MGGRGLDFYLQANKNILLSFQAKLFSPRVVFSFVCALSLAISLPPYIQLPPPARHPSHVVLKIAFSINACNSYSLVEASALSLARTWGEERRKKRRVRGRHAAPLPPPASLPHTHAHLVQLSFVGLHSGQHFAHGAFNQDVADL